MLDFSKLMPQIAEVGRESVNEADAQQARLEAAQSVLDVCLSRPEEFETRLLNNQEFAQWPVAIPIEPIVRTYPVQPATGRYCVVAADGSHILPSHHEVFSCYLLNFGTVIFTYGAPLHLPVLESSPLLCHRCDDLYPLIDGRRLHVDEQFIALARFAGELEHACLAAIRARERSLPVMALVDGSLIPWALDNMPLSYQADYTATVVGMFERFRQYEVPVLGYISQSRSSDVINTLRIWACPYQSTACRQHCGNLDEAEYPCSSMWPLADRQLMGSWLSRYSRSPAFRSSARSAHAFPPAFHICFTYLNLGHEVARIEFPRWLWENKELFEFALSAVLSQADKGMGYPVALAEAHNQAVVTAADRARFFNVLTAHLVGLGAGRVTLSPKEARKRRSII